MNYILKLVSSVFLLFSFFSCQNNQYVNVFEYEEFYDEKEMMKLDSFSTFYDFQKSIVLNACHFKSDQVILITGSGNKLPLNSGLICFWQGGNCALIRNRNVITINDTTTLHRDLLTPKVINNGRRKNWPDSPSKVVFNLKFSSTSPIKDIDTALDSIYMTYQHIWNLYASGKYHKKLYELEDEQLKNIASELPINLILAQSRIDDSLNLDLKEGDILSIETGK
ncbi:hypothetical protein [Flammeovirga sp. OC4]|uniref:hypothetical protein n=1 Tax=Flammeovirga sp. OC4 TaxID=1382345 RepID=UPI0005C5F90F|nr:hypothetical protein [Flammeovirga sp. OC4]